MTSLRRRLVCLSALVASTDSFASAWVPQGKVTLPVHKVKPLGAIKQEGPTFDPLHLASEESTNPSAATAGTTAATIATVALLSNPESVSAAVAGAPNAVGAALASYGHILSVMGIVASTIYERFTIKPNMSPEDEDGVAIADTLLGVWGLLLTYSGYLRVVQYEKGWDFYQHEPVFWIKIFFVSVYGASSFFNTTKIIQRSVAKRAGGTVPPMSEALAARMNQLLNAEITALLLIPLTAALMARGVGYNNDFPWPVGAAPSVLALLGLGFKYIKEALDFDDAEGVVPVSLGDDSDSQS